MRADCSDTRMQSRTRTTATRTERATPLKKQKIGVASATPISDIILFFTNFFRLGFGSTGDNKCPLERAILGDCPLLQCLLRQAPKCGLRF